MRNRRTGRRVAAILPVDLLGHPVDVAKLRTLAREISLPIIEDATESLGAEVAGAPIGAASTITCLSFNGNKVVTAAGGGMILTDEPTFAAGVRYLVNQAKDDPVEFVHRSIGFNYRLSNVQAAIGCAQLEQLGRFVAAKRAIAARYAEDLGGLAGVGLMRQAPWAKAAYWLYTIRVDASHARRSSRQLMAALNAEGIESRPLWQPLHRSPAHAESFRRPCPVSDALNRDCLSLPSSSHLTEDQQSTVIGVIRTELAG